MVSAKRLILLAVGVVLSASVVSAQDLSAYRDFRLGMSLAEVSAQTTTDSSAVRVVHQRPAVLQELAWRPRSVRGGSWLETDPVEEIVFSFYDDALFRVVVTYDRQKTDGLTEPDLIAGISATYGTETTPAAPVTSVPLSRRYRDNTERVIARWEDGAYSLNLIRSSYGPAFNLVMFSKRLDAMAWAAVSEAVQLDALEAPAREAERQDQRAIDTRAAQERARLANKPQFRP